ncbi:hypothetical protein Glove_283g145 [Diversispora epigaea]|uniref:ABC transporter domain-containing protein n=1 Tax=Diversispora epigaea TaxID=1348612 RepID=A0A397I719_9GLOM|nr:hypothetical protein Glove_283g145 [Diversispora epigaea]
MFEQPILTHPRFCFPTLKQKALLSPCGLETLIGITLLTYIIFGIIKWTLVRIISRHSRINDNEEIYNNLRIKGIKGYPKTLNKLVISIQILVGLEALLNITCIMLIFTEKERIGIAIPSYIIVSKIICSISWIINYTLVSSERKKWSYFTQGFWYLAFMLINIELYNRSMYILNNDDDNNNNNNNNDNNNNNNNNDDDDDICHKWTQNWTLIIICLLRYGINFMLVVCATTLTFFWRRSYESQGYGNINLQENNDDSELMDDDHDEDPLDTSIEDQQERLQSSTSEFQKPLSSIVEDPRYQPPHTLSDFYSKFKKLLPFVWPSHDIKLQIAIIICMLLLITGRIVNVLLPYRYKGLVDRLQDEEKVWKEIWKEILLFIGLRCLQGDVGLVNTVQNLLWIPVGQFTTREVSVKMFEHLLNLSLRFHLNRKTGEILRVQDRGVSSIVSILSSVIFNIIPTLVDIAIAIVIFTIAFDLFFGMIVFATMSLYIISTIIMTDWRTKYRRLTNLLDNNMEAKAVDSLLNYETVKLYAAEPFEVGQYTRAILDYQNADQKSNFTLYILNTAQNLIIQCGLLAGCILCASRISKGEMDVGDFVMYLTYILQLYGPLNWFGNYYRVIQKNFVDMEKMLDLLQESPEIKDLPQADPLVIKKGEVIFDKVSFSYDAKVPTLKSISFTIPSGSTVALVGPSGGGKSTIMRLLFRFYDVQSGRILVDGQDIRHVKQQDLRSCIGIVPQDTVLFNDTIKYNIRYGKIGANDRMVEEAAGAAQIHDKILGFSEGYGTKVGERGLRLSGGEKQRVAIARTILKNPQIVLLDEATSALDTRTERHIQKSLRKMTVNRTTLIIAHRLSTIVHADQILVLQDGEIVERGSHMELMQKEGVYNKLWNKQLKHHEKVKKEAETHQQDSGITTKAASSDSTSIANTVPSVNVDRFIREEEEEEEEEECGGSGGSSDGVNNTNVKGVNNNVKVTNNNIKATEHGNGNVTIRNNNKNNNNNNNNNNESNNNNNNNGSVSFTEEEGADGDDERQTTTPCESSDEEGDDTQLNHQS